MSAILAAILASFLDPQYASTDNRRVASRINQAPVPAELPIIVVTPPQQEKQQAAAASSAPAPEKAAPAKPASTLPSKPTAQSPKKPVKAAADKTCQRDKHMEKQFEYNTWDECYR